MSYFTGDTSKLFMRTEEDKEHEKQEEVRCGARCPICHNYAVRICNCNKKDSRCDEGHAWYIQDGKVVVGSVQH